MTLAWLLVSASFALLLPSNDAHIQTSVCPRGYWPAVVKSASPGQSIGDYSSDRDFNLPYGPIGNAPLCRFCPHVSCFIMKQEHKPVEGEIKDIKRRPRPHPTQLTTTTPKMPVLDDLFTIFDNTTSTKAPETHEEDGILMSCAKYNDLPFPEQIISYLDCVQIGQVDQFYLFIYAPVHQEKLIKPVDCIDPDFLKWVPRNFTVKGIELGFPMKRLPPYFFRYYGRMLASTQQVCIDSSALLNNEIDRNDLGWFGGKTLVQVVFRHGGLQRNRLPPKQPPNTAQTDTNSSELIADCPYFAPTENAHAYANKDCRFPTAMMPLVKESITKEEAAKNCTCVKCHYERPVIKVTRTEQNLLPVPRYVKTLLNMALLALVLVLIFGTVLGFCIQNRDKAMLLFLTRGRKRRREMEEALLREAAEKAAKEAEEAAQANWNPFGRYAAMAGLAGGGGGGLFAYGGPYGSRLPFPPAQPEPTPPQPSTARR